MHIKPQTVIPANVKITKCPPSDGNKARSVFGLERSHERQLERIAEHKVLAQKFAAALKVGFTAEEALKLIQQQDSK